MIKPIIISAAFLAVCQGIGDARANKQEPPAKVAPASSTSTKMQANLTPADYYVPLDRWLKAQGSPLSGKDAYEVGKQYGIDPDFLIAVTKAETNLCKVKQRGSAYNCGSVGSYDSTATTFTANSYRHGFEQIAQTVTGPNLRYAKRVSELSRKRNHDPNKKIYASSSYNWDTNMVNTMNEIKGTNHEDFFIYKQ